MAFSFHSTPPANVLGFLAASSRADERDHGRLLRLLNPPVVVFDGGVPVFDYRGLEGATYKVVAVHHVLDLDPCASQSEGVAAICLVILRFVTEDAQQQCVELYTNGIAYVDPVEFSIGVQCE